MAEKIIYEWSGSCDAHYRDRVRPEKYEYTVPSGTSELVVGCTFILDPDATSDETPIIVINGVSNIGQWEGEKEYPFGLSSPAKQTIKVTPGERVSIVMPTHNKGPFDSSDNVLTSYYIAENIKAPDDVYTSIGAVSKPLKEIQTSIGGVKHVITEGWASIGGVKKLVYDPLIVHVYGVEWDWTSSGLTKGKRTDDAAESGDPNPAVNNGSGSSPFDNLYPWKDMTKVTRTGGVMVKEPKYWYKWTKTGKKLKLQIADGPVEGFHVDPVNMDRGDGLGELDCSYIGRYHCASGTYKSETNKAQQVSITRSTASTQIHNLGANIWQMDFAQFWYVGMLFLVEFADWNGQTRIGYGCSQSSSKQNNGRTDSMQYHTGTTAANRTTYGFTQYRNIEGWWDNVYDWMDGCYYNGNGLNVIKNPAQFSDNANGVLVGKPVGGYPSDFALPTQSGLEWALYPSAAAGSTTTYVPDSWHFNGGYPCLRHGGYHVKYQDRGPFYVDCSGVSASYSYIGCRLQERPPKL